MKKKKQAPPAPPPARVELSDNPVKLCNEIARIFRTTMRESTEAEGIMTQHGAHLVLSFLAIGDGITQLDLVKATHLRAPTVSLILKRMEEEGIVRRVSDERDARAVRVYLTDYGKKIDRQHINQLKALDSKALEGISQEEFDTLMLLLTKIRNNLINTEENK